MVKRICLIFGILFFMSGCDLKMDTMEGASICVTNYPTEYITSRLYGEHSDIKSIYPNGINIDDYKLRKMQIDEYSLVDLYIFNGLNEREKGYFNDFRKKK